MDHYQFWLLDEAETRTQGMLLACTSAEEAWLVADALLAECRAVEIWRDLDLIGRLGDQPPPIEGAAVFVWPGRPPRRRKAKVKAATALKATG